MKTTITRIATIKVGPIKDSDGWGDLIHALKLKGSAADLFFEFGEYASLELKIDDSLNIVGGRVLPIGEW